MRAGIRGGVIAVAILAMGLLGLSAALAVGTLTSDVSEIYFGHSGSSQDIVLTNGDAADPVEVTAVTITPTGQFTEDAPDSFPVVAGTPVTVTVTWDPSGVPTQVSDTAVITFVDDSPAADVSVALAGGKPYTMETITSQPIDLGNVNVNQPELGSTIDPLHEGMNSHSRVRFNHAGPGFPDVEITASDNSDPAFAVNPGDFELKPDQDADFKVGFDPAVGEPDEDQGSITFYLDVEPYTEEPDFTETVLLEGERVNGDVLYRVNSGGREVVEHPDGLQSFTVDFQGSNSPYFANTGPFDSDDSHSTPPEDFPNTTNDPSLPAGTPEEIFDSERYDPNSSVGNAGIPYRFPLPAQGTHVVRLYFADHSANSPGDRLFDVEIEGSRVLDDFDIYAVANGRNVGIARAFLVDANADIDIEVVREKRNPILNGIEILTGGDAQVSAPAVDFEAGVVGGLPISDAVTITNQADLSGPAARIDSATISGAHEGDFDVDLPGPTWIAPGESLELDATFDPHQAGNRSAVLTLGVWGDDDLTVNLNGSAQVPSGTLNVTPGTVDFGTVELGSSGTETVTLTHGSGSKPILIQTVTITSSSASVFSIVGDVPGSVAVGGSAEIQVRFSPSTASSAAASLRIDHSGTKLASTVSLSGTGIEPLSSPGDPFTDDDGSIFESDIEWLAGVGITKGCNPPENDLFCPDDNVTRGQMAAFFVRALGLTDDGSGDLFDDDEGSVFEGDIDRFGTAGITRGCNPPDNNLFCPNDNVTRGQMAAFFVRALDLTDDGGGDQFVDDDGSVFEGDIDRFAQAGITRGCNPPTNDEFCPGDFVTRGQMAAFFHRAAGLLGLPD